MIADDQSTYQLLLRCVSDWLHSPSGMSAKASRIPPKLRRCVRCSRGFVSYTTPSRSRLRLCNCATLEKAVNRLERKAAGAIEEDTQAEAGVGITFYLPYTKADRAHAGTTFHTPALKKLCPVEAYINWITVAGVTRDPVFRKLHRWGTLLEKGFKSSSLIPLLRRILEDADIPAQAYSSHSMRRSFATWASANGWDIKGLMSYVGWRDMKSALRYVEASNSFGSLAVTDSRANALELDH